MPSSSKTPAPVAECHGVKVPDSPMMSPQRIARINGARYEGQEIAGALSVVKPGDRVLELGAGIGLVGAVVAHNAQPEKVLSFEANPGLIEHIEAMHRLNGLEDRMEIRNEVLISAPDAPETMTFHLHKSYLGSSLIGSDIHTGQKVEVPTASYARVHADFAPTVLLMDIEGGELDFLRHASLEGVRAIVVEFHPGVYGREGMMECKSILEQAGFAKQPEHCTRHVWTCTHDPAVQPPMPEQGWSGGIERLEKAVVVPPLENGLVQQTGVLTAKGAPVPGGALWRNGRALTPPPEMPEGKIATRKGTWLWGGVLWMHFGHFMVESLARLWALEEVGEEIDGILFVPKRPRNGSEVLDYQRALVAAMGTDKPLVCVEAPERVERLIVPGQGFGLGAMVGGTDAFRAAVSRRFGRDIPAEGPEKLYISRSLLPSGRGNLIGEAELEAHLAADGYTIYHPEKHDIRHQIATYKAARKVVAAEGSALHLFAMVGNAEAEVAMIVRRPSGATRNIETHIAAFTGRSPVVISQLTRSWKPRGPAKPRKWMGELDMPALRDALVEAGLVSEKAPSWAALDPKVVKSRLGRKFEEVA